VDGYIAEQIGYAHASFDKEREMSIQVFDKLLELRNVADGAETSTASEAGVAMQVRFLPVCDWVIHVTALDAASADETYVFTLEVSDASGGTYTAIASHTWPRGHGAGTMHIPINGDMASFQDTDSDWIRVTATLGGTSPSITYGSYLAKAANKHGIAAKPGDVVTFP
jgi:hypothetical protein